MKKIKVSDNVCGNCARFTQFYNKSFHNFYPCEYGHCGVKEQTVKAEGNCVFFCKRKKRLLTAENVSGAINAVNELEEIFRRK